MFVEISVLPQLVDKLAIPGVSLSAVARHGGVPKGERGKFCRDTVAVQHVVQNDAYNVGSKSFDHEGGFRGRCGDLLKDRGEFQHLPRDVFPNKYFGGVGVVNDSNLK